MYSVRSLTSWSTPANSASSSAHMIPGTQLSENTIKEALITSFVSQCTTSPSECAVTESMFGDASIFRS
jgi:hypothetical protein